VPFFSGQRGFVKKQLAISVISSSLGKIRLHRKILLLLLRMALNRIPPASVSDTSIKRRSRQFVKNFDSVFVPPKI